MSDVIIINKFPDWFAPDFKPAEWNAIFKRNNVILNANVTEAVYPVHWGPLSIKFAFNGSECYETENCRYKVSDGKYILMNEDQMYSSSLMSHYMVRSFSINFCTKFKNEKLSEILAHEEKILDEPDFIFNNRVNFFAKLYQYDDLVIPRVLKLKQFVDSKNYNSLYINERLSEILDALLRVHLDLKDGLSNVPAKKSSTRIEIYRRLFRAKDYIESNFDEAVSLDTLGKVACMNPHHLLRKFKEYFRITPHQFLTNIRLNEAKQMLCAKDISVTEVCMNVGFEDVSSFSKLFKKKFGVSPSQFVLIVR